MSENFAEKTNKFQIANQSLPNQNLLMLNYTRVAILCFRRFSYSPVFGNQVYA